MLVLDYQDEANLIKAIYERNQANSDCFIPDQDGFVYTRIFRLNPPKTPSPLSPSFDVAQSIFKGRYR